MRTAQIHRRLESLSSKIRPNGRQQITLEELCRQYWRLDRRGFLAFVNRDGQVLRVFVDMFEREEAERAAPARVAARGRADR
jgi:hypothetical protein